MQPRRLALQFAAGLLLAVGLSATAQSFQQPQVVPTGNWPTGIVAADVNGDGKPDLIVTDYGASATSLTTHVLLNNGNGTFTSSATIATAGTAIAAADFDGDGHIDLEWVWVIQGEGKVFFAQGNGDGTFQPTVELGTFAQIGSRLPQLSFVMAARMHDSGYLDLMVEDVANSALFELTADNSGTLVRLVGTQLPNGAGPMFAADLNGDGHTDLVIQSLSGGSIDVYLGSSNGLLQPGAPVAGTSGVRSMLLQDVDGDGHPDLVFETAPSQIAILHGESDGTFSISPEGGSSPADPASGNGGHLVAATNSPASGRMLYTATAAGLSALSLNGTLQTALQGIYNAGPGRNTFAIADFNGDGLTDIALDSPEGVAILFANPDGSLRSSHAFSTGAAALSGVLGGFSGSGSLDAVVGLGGTQTYLLHGNGDGTFTGATASTASLASSQGMAGALVSGDFNGDGKPDLAITRNGVSTPANSNGVSVQFGNGDGTFSAPAPVSGSVFGSSIAASFAGDGLEDLANAGASGQRLLLAQAGDSFTPSALAATASPSGLAAAGDLNHDGRPDLVALGESSWNVYLNQGSGNLALSGSLPGTPSSPGLIASAVAIADLDGDGNSDVIALYDDAAADHAHPAATLNNRIYIWYGHGDGTFDAPIQVTPARSFYQLAVLDADGDGRPDLVMSDGYLLSVLRNLGSRSFGKETHWLAGRGINAIASGDVNKDGATDLVLANGGGIFANLSSAPGITAASQDVATGGITVLLNATHTIAGITTSIALTMTTPTNIQYGQIVDGYAQVSSADGSPVTGTITFLDGKKNICVVSVALKQSCPAGATSGFAAGTHLFSAAYSGDTTHAAASSNVISVMVTPDTTTASLSSSASPAKAGQNILLSATVRASNATATGPVTFLDGSTVLGTAALNMGVASLSTASLSAGTHTLSAVYAATQNFSATTSTPLTLVVQPASSLVGTASMLSSTSNPSLAGQSITITANVVTVGPSLRTPTGLVTLLDGTAVLGTAILDANGLATWTSASLVAGTHSLSASYAGDTTSAPSLSPDFAQVVNTVSTATQASFSITTAASASVFMGQKINLQVNVAPLNGFQQAVQLGCTHLPSEASCTFAPATVPAGGGTVTMQLSTVAPHNCGSSTSYFAAGNSISLAGPAFAGLLLLLIPRRHRVLKGLLLAVLAIGSMATLSGCGACTDLGTLPGTYTITITGQSTGTTQATATQNIQVTVND